MPVGAELHPRQEAYASVPAEPEVPLLPQEQQVRPRTRLIAGLSVALMVGGCLGAALGAVTRTAPQIRGSSRMGADLGEIIREDTEQAHLPSTVASTTPKPTTTTLKPTTTIPDLTTTVLKSTSIPKPGPPPEQMIVPTTTSETKPATSPEPTTTPELTTPSSALQRVHKTDGCELGVPLFFKSHRDLFLRDQDDVLSTGEHESGSQRWVLSDAGDDEYIISSHRKDLLCGRDTNVSLRREAEADGQKWRIDGAGFGRAFIRSHDGTYLQDNNGKMQLTDNADEWEKWTIYTVDGAEACNFPSLQLFCITVMKSWGPELALVKKQRELGAGIFGCEESLVLSDKEEELGGGKRSALISPDVLSPRWTYKNSDLFFSVWQRVKADRRYEAADWVVKADPQTVFLPDRLRARLGGKRHAASYSTFYANCAAKVDIQSKEHPHFMYGPLEIFSKAGVETYFQGAGRCRKEVGLGESMWEERFMTHCLELLGTNINPHLSLHLLRDPHCDNSEVAPDCLDDSVAYHKFSSVEAYTECWSVAHGPEIGGSEANMMNSKK